MNTIVVVVLTKNEEKNIEKCIRSLTWCDQVIIIDDYSEDNTAQIAKKHGALVYKNALNNDFAQQRNFALQQIRGKWVLFVDADEIISQDLADEIKRAINSEEVKGYYL